MRILVFSWRDPKHPLAGGAEQVMHQHMKSWVKAGHQVTLFSSGFKDSPSQEMIDGVQVVRRGSQYLGVQLAGFIYYQQNKDKVDLVIDQFHGLPFFTPLYVKKPKLAVIQETAREVWFLNHLDWPLNWMVGLAGFLGEPLIFLLYKKVPFITGSESAKKDLVKFGIASKNIHVIHHGVIIEDITPLPPKEKKPTVAFLGVLSKDKGIEDALRCFSLLRKKGNFQFWVIGKPETEKYAQRLKKITQNLGLDGEVKFWGFVPQEKKYEFLARSHLLVNPSVREGWGLVNIEANCMNTPVVAYRSMGLVDSVKDKVSGLLCKRNTPENMADLSWELLADKAKYFKLQKQALLWGKSFSWDKSSGLSLKLIKEVKG